MSAWSLPTTVTLAGREYAIRSDYRAVLDALAALNDPELSTREQYAALLAILYPDWQELPDTTEALNAAFVFINGGEPIPENQTPRPALVDWERDAGIIAPAVDKVLGKSCRQMPYLHWWEFIGAYQNIGKGLFFDIVGLRAKKARGAKLDKEERRFIKENPQFFTKKQELTSAEEEFLKSLGV